MSEALPETPEAAPDAKPKRKVRTPGSAPAAEASVEVSDATSAGLPNAIDVDPRAITGPVLTRQGWVVPDAEHLAKQRRLAALQAELSKG